MAGFLGTFAVSFLTVGLYHYSALPMLSGPRKAPPWAKGG